MLNSPAENKPTTQLNHKDLMLFTVMCAVVSFIGQVISYEGDLIYWQESHGLLLLIRSMVSVYLTTLVVWYVILTMSFKTKLEQVLYAFVGYLICGMILATVATLVIGSFLEFSYFSPSFTFLSFFELKFFEAAFFELYRSKRPLFD